MALSESFKRGTVDLLVLTLLQDQDMYGYQLSQELESRSRQRYSLQESSLYPTLYRLMDKGLISDRQEKVGKRRIRVYYHLEESGKQYLETIRGEYLSLSRGVLDILGITDFASYGEEVSRYESSRNQNLSEGSEKNAATSAAQTADG